MNAGWCAQELREVSSINYGYTESASAEPIGPKFLRITDIQDSGVDWERVPYCKIDSADLSKFRLQTDDIVFARTGATTGKSYLIKDPPNAVFASYLIRLRLHERKLLPQFLSYFFQSGRYWEAIKTGSTGSAQGGFNASKLGALVVPIPPLVEQKRIVGILGKAFEAIETAEANTDKNLLNAGALFRSKLEAIFVQDGTSGYSKSRNLNRLSQSTNRSIGQGISQKPRFGEVDRDDVPTTKTGGRAATLRHIPGKFALSVGMPKTPAKEGWKWELLTDLARLESGHTPSRKHPEYWGGSIPWIGIQDAREHHGGIVHSTIQHTNDLGIANSSARVLPPSTVCLSRTASVGYVVVTGRPMATSQDFVNWVCSEQLNPSFLKYLFLAEGDGLLRFASGAVHSTIYFPEAKAFHICHPEPSEQANVVAELDELLAESKRLEKLYQQRKTALAELRKSILDSAFSARL